MSKITFYVQRFPNQGDHDFVTAAVQAGVSSIKIEGQLSEVEYAHSLNPDLLIVYRNIADLEGDDDGGFKQEYKPLIANPHAAAQEHVRRVKAHMGNRAKYAYICSPYNEIGPLDDPALRRWYSEFEVERMRLYEEIKRKAAILCVGVKANLHDKITEFLPAFQRAYLGGHVIVPHAYNSPRLSDNGPFANDISEGLLPHRLLYDELKRRGVGVARFFFGEGGHDAVASSFKMASGFRNMGIGNDEVVADYRWWEEQFVKRVLGVRIGFQHPADALLIGIAAFLFSDGDAIQPEFNLKWAGGNRGQVRGVAYQWLDFIRGNRGDAVPSGGTTTPPTPTPDPGQPSPGVYVTTGAVNIRPQPNTSQPEVGAFKAGAAVPFVEFVRGASYQNNPWWGKLADGLYVSAYFLRRE